ncbi:MAG: alpha/beta hydrolase [Pirellulaceae bacterium]|nr:MAG: alpha/beta hydrolase [Pirellulaceae bacterium]
MTAHGKRDVLDIGPGATLCRAKSGHTFRGMASFRRAATTEYSRAGRRKAMEFLRKNTAQVLWLLLALLGTATLCAGEPVEMLLWPGGAPGALGTEPKDQPKLIRYLPEEEKACGTALVILPGGGYGHLAMDHEGHQIARWCNQMGCAGFIVDYRHRNKGYGHPAPLQDAQRAIRTVRAHAQQWGIRADRIGVIGFSAGGHLASCTAVFFDEGRKDAEDPIERVSSRPDFAILCYPVIGFGEPYGHTGSQRNLLGPDATPERVAALATHRHVRSDSPPTFLWHTTEDAGVPVENSVHFYLALRAKGVPCELHVFEKGRHGLGLARGAGPAERWPELCQAWLQQHGLLQATP